MIVSRAERWTLAAGIGTVLFVLAIVQDGGGSLSELDQESVWVEPGPVLPAGFMSFLDSVPSSNLASLQDLGLQSSYDFDTSSDTSPLQPDWEQTSWGQALERMLAELKKKKKHQEKSDEKSTSSGEQTSPPLPIGTQNITGKDRFIGKNWRRYLFLTSHGGNGSHKSNNVRIYDYQVSAKHLHHWKMEGYALEGAEVASLGLQNLRGMRVVGDALFIASAHSSRSKIVITEKCAFDPREAKTFSRDRLDHPYGLAFFRGEMFTASQNTDEVVKFSIQDGFNAKAQYFATVKNPRGLAFDRFGHLWVASTKKGVYVFDRETAKVVAHIDIKHAVGVALHFQSNVIYVGSVQGSKSCVYGFDANTLKVVHKLTVEKPFKLTHPAGIAIAGDRLFVVGQDSRNLYAWDVRNGAFKGAVLTDLPKRPEHVAIVKCPQ